MLNGILSDLRPEGDSITCNSMAKLYSVLSRKVNQTQRDNCHMVSYVMKSETHGNKMQTVGYEEIAMVRERLD